MSVSPMIADDDCWRPCLAADSLLRIRFVRIRLNPVASTPDAGAAVRQPRLDLLGNPPAQVADFQAARQRAGVGHAQDVTPAATEALSDLVDVQKRAGVGDVVSRH